MVMQYNGFEEFCGDWDHYKSVIEDTVIPEKKPTLEKQNKNDYVKMRQLRSERTRIRSAMARAEKAVAEGEREVHSLEEQLSGLESAADLNEINRIYTKITELRHDLEQRYSAWEAAEMEYMDLTGKDDLA